MIEQNTKGNGVGGSDGTSVPPTEHLSSEETARLRLARIHEYLEESLRQHDKLQRCLAPLMCDLLEMCQKLKAGIDAEQEKSESFIVVLRQIEPAYQMYLAMARQIDRLAQLEIRSRAK